MSHHLQHYNPLDWSREDFFDDFLRGRFPIILNEERNLIKFPKVNVSDNDKSVIVTANVPGIQTKDITIDVDDNILTLRGHAEREEEEGKKDSDFYRFEREEGSFVRTISLPAFVDKNKVEAKTKNGVLTITLPKTENKDKQKIHIKEE